MSKVPVSYKRTDMQSDQEVKWCPGCGDYTILASVQSFMAELGISKEKMVFVFCCVTPYFWIWTVSTW